MDMSDKKEKAPIFSAKNLKLLTSPFGQNNPVTVQILGICSALAVTAKLKPAFVMALVGDRRDRLFEHDYLTDTQRYSRRVSALSYNWSSLPRSSFWSTRC